MAATARQKRSYLHHQGEFQHQNCTVGTVHDSDHDGVVGIFVRHSCHSNELFILIGASVSEPHIDEFNVNFLYFYISIYLFLYFYIYFYISTRGNRTPGSRCNAAVASP